jgi:hypothetical protein
MDNPNSPTTIPKPDRKESTFPLRLVYLGLAIIIFGILIGVLASRFFPAAPVVAPSTLAPADYLIGPVSPTASEIVGWKTYTNTNGQYSFRYPANWNAITSSKNNNEVFFGPAATSEKGLGGLEMRTTSPNTKQKIADFLSGLPGLQDLSWGSETVDTFAFTPQQSLTDNKTNIIYSNTITINNLQGLLEKYEGDVDGFRFLTKITIPSATMSNLYLNSLDPNDIKIYNLILNTLQSTAPTP